MKKHFITLIIILCLCCSLFASYNLNKKSISQIDATLQQYVSSLKIPGMAFVLVDKDSVVFEGYYGNCTSENDTFFIGSMTKSFTAICIMQMYEQGLIDLDAPLSKYIDCKNYFINPSDADRITIRQLLNHASGLSTYQRLGNARITKNYNKYEYGNVNFNLLGKVVESVSKMPYENYVKKNIFNPLGLNNTGASEASSINSNLLPGYHDWFGITTNGKNHYPDDSAWFITPAGYLTSCGNDICKYLQLYLNGGKGIISKESINMMHNTNRIPCSSSKNNNQYYGFAWTVTIDNTDGTTVLSHVGKNDNFTSQMTILPDKELAFAILTNKNDRFLYDTYYPQIDQNIISIINNGKPEKKIPNNAHAVFHLFLDILYAGLILLSFVPLIKRKKIIAKTKKMSVRKALIYILLINNIIPVAFVILLQIIAYTPLWVVKDYVPDLFAVIVTFITIPFITGIYSIYTILCNKKTDLK